jgi:hypothetical protein
VSKSDDPVLEDEHYEGALGISGENLPIGFRLSAGADCRLKFDLDAVDGKTYILAMRSSGRPGQSQSEFSLSGRSANGKLVASDSMSILGGGANGDGHLIRVAARVATVTVPLERPAPKPILRLWFRAFTSFRNSPIKTPLGLMAVNGAAKDVARDDMSGSVAIEAPDGAVESDWKEKADRFLRHMHHGLAFAHGGRLQTPRLDHVEGGEFHATFLAGSGFQPEFAVQHFLNQDPFIEALADRYFQQGPLPDILWTALGWMQTGTTFDEIRFLTAMTALETITEGALSDGIATIIPKEKFKPLRVRLEDVIKAEADLTDQSRQIFLGKVAGLNKGSFNEKINALFDHYEISRSDFGGRVIGELIRLRNDIVHRGTIPDDVDVWPNIILVRELITRIILTEVGFKGRYCCYIGGQHDRDFPEKVEASTA